MKKGGAPRLPFTDYFPDGALQQGPPGALDSPACRSGSTEKGSGDGAGHRLDTRFA